MNIEIGGFADNESKQIVSYVVAEYSKDREKWFWCAESEEIGEAKEYLNDFRKAKKNCKFGLFERIRTETIAEITGGLD